MSADLAIARSSISLVKCSTDLKTVTKALGSLACVHLSSEDEQKLKVAEFLDDCVERGVLHRCYARMLLRGIRKLKKESAEGLKPSKKKAFPIKKIPMKVSQ
ncbi:hypothetical protein QR680_011922 [Steinernema hermaphroditum]|uniref:Uncharacterized protein n=1 Tax=Steinernema hermaphroditum TaxID=289476 RepID=A0AA39I2Q4_9BILA|nr:hypothetical protein QR680_011922 [Steinernema hermaphroditum]